MNQEAYVARKADNNLMLLSSVSAALNTSNHIISGRKVLPTVDEVVNIKIPTISSEINDCEPITSQPTINHNESTEIEGCSDSELSTCELDQNSLDNTLTKDTSPGFENENSLSISGRECTVGLTNHAFVGEDDPSTPRPHKMNYTCAHPQACTKCNNPSELREDEKNIDSVKFPGVIAHEVVIVNKPSVTSAPGKALRKLDPRKLNLTLDLFSSRGKKKEKNKSNNSSNNSSISPKSTPPFSVAAMTNNDSMAAAELKSNQKANVMLLPPIAINDTVIKEESVQTKIVQPYSAPKTSWLLRLFESQVSFINSYVTF